jgi:hypothetical protein
MCRTQSAAAVHTPLGLTDRLSAPGKLQACTCPQGLPHLWLICTAGSDVQLAPKVLCAVDHGTVDWVKVLAGCVAALQQAPCLVSGLPQLWGAGSVPHLS